MIGVGMFIRLGLAASPVSAEVRRGGQTRRAPIVDVPRTSSKTVLLAAGSYTGISAIGYIGLVYYVSYATRVLGLSLPTVLTPLLVAAILFGAAVVAFARWSDRIGRRRIMLWGNGALVAWSAVFFPLLDTRSIPAIWIALCVILVLQGAYIGTQPAVFAELFPPSIRYSGASLSNTLGAILGGAPAPFIAAALYLRPRIFEPLGIRGVDWDLTPQGINVGMIGLRARTEDLAKFGQLLLQRGEWNGKQLLPASWVAEATSRHIASSGSGADWEQGYGYQMWRGRHNSVRLDGLGGQFVLLLPDKDALVVLTANAAQSTQKQLDLVWDHLLPAMKDVGSLPEDAASNRSVRERVASLKVSAPPGAAVNATLVSKIAGNTFQLDSNRFGIESVSFKFGEDGVGELAVARSDSQTSVKMGNGAWVVGNLNVNSLLRPSTPSKSRDANDLLPGTPYRVATSFAWPAPNTLAVTTRFVEESIGSETVLYKFSEEGDTVRVSIEEQRAGGFPGGPGPQNQAPLTGTMVATERP